MPELIEVELYRQDLDTLVGRSVDAVILRDDRAIRPKDTPGDLLDVLIGNTLRETRRHGKLLLADFEGPEGLNVLGLRFGMTGRLLVDGVSSIRQLEYASARNDSSWDRFVMVLDGVEVALRDQRCLGSVELDPDTKTLAPEASTITPESLQKVFTGRTKAVKAALLDQSIVAGLGNLLADEVLWVADLSPLKPVDELTPDQVGRLANEICATVERLSVTGGSNTGESFPARHAGASCPRCSGTMGRDTIGGRTAWWCSTHQV